MVDFTKIIGVDKQDQKTMLIAEFRLTQEDILEALKHNVIYINGRTYENPKLQIWEVMRQKPLYGYDAEVFELKLTEIKQNGSTEA